MKMKDKVACPGNRFISKYLKVEICVIKSEGVPCFSLDIMVRFVPSCYPDSASSTHLHEFDGHKDASIWPSTALEGA